MVADWLVSLHECFQHRPGPRDAQDGKIPAFLMMFVKPKVDSLLSMMEIVGVQGCQQCRLKELRRIMEKPPVCLR